MEASRGCTHAAPSMVWQLQTFNLIPFISRSNLPISRLVHAFKLELFNHDRFVREPPKLRTRALHDRVSKLPLVTPIDCIVEDDDLWCQGFCWRRECPDKASTWSLELRQTWLSRLGLSCVCGLSCLCKSGTSQTEVQGAFRAGHSASELFWRERLGKPEVRLPKLGRGAAPHRRRLGDGHSGVLDLGGWGYIIYYMFYLIYLIYYNYIITCHQEPPKVVLGCLLLQAPA